ncbi:TonB-dependent receptor [Nubsella zeaxanthinifaciens]|uniref:TonB-dependent receptor n=1 Tax=Nubsella zeaxanthinifaciens TaxID=392412 RepID=UPI003CFC2693
MVDIVLPNKKVIHKEYALKANIKDRDIQFFPEGGQFVECIPNNIAIKIINQNGMGEPASFIVFNSQRMIVAKAETNKLGMGSFFLTPENNERYTAELIFNDGSKKVVNLPNTSRQGTVLTVRNLDEQKLSVHVYFSETLVNNQKYNLIIHQNGRVYFSSPILSKSQVNFVTIPKDSLPVGIVQITLLSENLIPLNERIAFISSSKQKIDIALDSAAISQGKKGLVNLVLTAKKNDMARLTNLSIAVTNAVAVEPDFENETNILTRLLLTSDLAGHVEKPNYYFLKDDWERRFDLDNLLLTQGWRKINWQELTSDNEKTHAFPVEKTLKVSGKVSLGSKPKPAEKISLLSISNGFLKLDTITDKNGLFVFDDIDFEEERNFLLQTETKQKQIKILVDTISPPLTANNEYIGEMDQNVNQTLKKYLQESEKHFLDQEKKGFLSKTNLLKEVSITAKKPVPSRSKNINGAGNADKIFTEKDLKGVTRLANFLKARVAGLAGDGPFYLYNNRYPMLLIVDGMMNDDVLKNVENIESIEILKNAGLTSAYGGRGAGGVMIITTKIYDPSKNATPPLGITAFKAKGYSTTRTFYVPKYDTTENEKPDLRTTIFWEPNLNTDTDGKAKISYFNADVPGTYRLVIEGIDVQGNLARKVLNYDVK